MPLKSFFKKEKPLVNFIICGAQKSGTTALHAYLSEHPDIFMPDKKELHFFDDEKNFTSRKPNYSNYHANFSTKKSHGICGESTPIYMYWHAAPRRIYDYNSKMKFIVLLRNPIDRAFSHWNMERLRNADNLPFWEALQQEAERCREALPFQHRVFSYADRGHYLEQLRRLWMYFPENQILIIKSDDLKKNLTKTLSTIYEFLGVRDVRMELKDDIHALRYADKISLRERQYLKSVFEFEIRNLERVLHWDCSDWLKE